MSSVRQFKPQGLYPIVTNENIKDLRLAADKGDADAYQQILKIAKVIYPYSKSWFFDILFHTALALKPGDLQEISGDHIDNTTYREAFLFGYGQTFMMVLNQNPKHVLKLFKAEDAATQNKIKALLVESGWQNVWEALKRELAAENKEDSKLNVRVTP